MKIVFTILFAWHTSILCYANYIVSVHYTFDTDFIAHSIETSLNSWGDIKCDRSKVFPELNTNLSLFITWKEDAYTQTELESLNSYVRNGGRLLFFGECVNAGGPAKANISANTALAFIGSSMTLGKDCFDTINQTAAGEQIVPHPLTERVLSLKYAAANSVSGGVPLLISKDLQNPFFAYEQVGNGYVLVSGDLNIAPGVMGENIGNDIFFRNLTVAEIPEPNSIMLLLVGAGIIFKCRRKGFQP